ncbi:hypothetical protein BDB01DRAFT_834909 [Pilobolus umbonatus]|nr:hypothetical protein BDB01DRAFT_834909 [Pilobolus umbonatus]
MTPALLGEPSSLSIIHIILLYFIDEEHVHIIIIVKLTNAYRHYATLIRLLQMAIVSKNRSVNSYHQNSMDIVVGSENAELIKSILNRHYVCKVRTGYRPDWVPSALNKNVRSHHNVAGTICHQVYLKEEYFIIVYYKWCTISWTIIFKHGVLRRAFWHYMACFYCKQEGTISVTHAANASSNGICRGHLINFKHASHMIP